MSPNDTERATRDSVAVVPSFLLFLIRFLLGSKRWGDACACQGQLIRPVCTIMNEKQLKTRHYSYLIQLVGLCMGIPY